MRTQTDLRAKQNALIHAVVAELDSMVEQRYGQDLPETALHSWHDRLTKLCKAYARLEYDNES